jgi:hypothetical protein
MKTLRSAKAQQNNAAGSTGQHPVRVRPPSGRTIEPRAEWRKIREQLRRRDWPLNTYG